MGSNNVDDNDFSGSDSDDGFEDDMEALRKACILSGTKPDDIQCPSVAATSAAAGPTVPGGAISDSDGDDDLELVRRIQERFSITKDDAVLNTKPLCSLPPVEWDDDDDDFEILRAIKMRFGQYDNDCQKRSRENYLHKPEQVHATNIASEKYPTSNLSVDRTIDFEESPDCLDPCKTTRISESFSENIPGTLGSDLSEWHQSGGQDLPTFPSRDTSFPKSAQVFIDAIKKNRSCQKFLRSKMIQIEARIEENKKLKDRVKILKDFQFACRRRTGLALSQKKDARVQLISVQKQRANAKGNEKKVPAMSCGPKENSHVSIYRTALTKFPVSFRREKWSEKEKENLAKGIKQQYQEALFQKSVDLFSGERDTSGVSNDFDSIMESIRDLDITPENIRLFLPKVNWDQLASMYVPSHSGAECLARWLNCEDPLINHHTWTNMEDKNLLHIVQQKGIDNWIDIAVSLGANRTPFQCLARYQRSLNAMILKREWTEAEDDKLRAAVETFGESNWQLVASTLEGRTGTQCSNRWNKSLHPARQRVGKWTPDEDKRLKVAVMLFGPKTWKKIAQYVPGRTQVQCRERWVNSLDPSLNLDKWTEEEDSRLEAAIAEHGYRWSKVAACLPPRTDSQCRRRWKVLFPHEVPRLRASKNLQKAALISNFVDRESERPALGPNDFIPLTLTNSIPESENVNSSGKQKRKPRRRLDSKTKAQYSRDNPMIRSERLIGEAEKNGKVSSKKKRVRKSSLSCPEPTLSTITNSKEVGASDRDRAAKNKKAPSGRQKRKSRLRLEPQEFDAAFGNDAISLAENKDSIPTKEQPLSCPDSSILMIASSEEACVSGSTEASKQRLRKKKCIGLQEEVPGMTNSDEVDTFCGNGIFPMKEMRVVRPHSEKNKGGDPTEVHSFSWPNSTMSAHSSGGEGEASSRDNATTICGQLTEKLPEMINSNEAETFSEDETISEWRKRLTEPHLEHDKCIDHGQDHSSACPDLRLHRTVGGGDPGKKKAAPNQRSRSRYAKLLQEISEINDSVVVEVLRENVAFPKKKRATKRLLEKNEEFEALDENQILERERNDGDNSTLACFLHNRLKKRRIELSQNGNDG